MEAMGQRHCHTDRNNQDLYNIPKRVGACRYAEERGVQRCQGRAAWGRIAQPQRQASKMMQGKCFAGPTASSTSKVALHAAFPAEVMLENFHTLRMWLRHSS